MNATSEVMSCKKVGEEDTHLDLEELKVRSFVVGFHWRMAYVFPCPNALP